MSLGKLWQRPYVLLFLAAVMWASNAIVGRAARDIVPPMSLSFWRWMIALLIIAPIGWRYFKRDFPVMMSKPGTTLALGCLGVGAYNSMLYLGLQSTAATNALLLLAAQPATILVAGSVLMGDRISFRQKLGVAIAALGVSVVLLRGNIYELNALRFTSGDVYVGIAVLCWAVYSVLLRKRPKIHAISFLMAAIIVGTIAILPFYLIELASGARMSAVPESFATIAYVAIFPSLIAFVAFNRGVELLGSDRAGIFMNVLPLVGFVMALALLGEQPRIYHFVGIALILVGVLLPRRQAAESAGKGLIPPSRSER